MNQTRNYISESALRRKSRRKYYFVFSWITLILAIMVIVAWFFIASPFFQIQKIDIVGNNFVSRADVISLLEARIFQNSWRKHLLGSKNILVWPDILRLSDLIFYPEIKNVSISKHYFKRSISIKVTERAQVGVWCYGGEDGACWWFDDEGMLFRRSPSTQGNLIVTVKDYSQKGGGLGSKILQDQFLDNFLSIVKVLKEAKLGESEILIKDIAFEEAEIPLKNGPTLYFSLRFPSTNTLAALSRLSARADFRNLQYIDFRVENKVYYK